MDRPGEVTMAMCQQHGERVDKQSENDRRVTRSRSDRNVVQDPKRSTPIWVQERSSNIEDSFQGRSSKDGRSTPREYISKEGAREGRTTPRGSQHLSLHLREYLTKDGQIVTKDGQRTPKEGTPRSTKNSARDSAAPVAPRGMSYDSRSYGHPGSFERGQYEEERAFYEKRLRTIPAHNDSKYDDRNLCNDRILSRTFQERAQGFYESSYTPTLRKTRSIDLENGNHPGSGNHPGVQQQNVERGVGYNRHSSSGHPPGVQCYGRDSSKHQYTSSKQREIRDREMRDMNKENKTKTPPHGKPRTPPSSLSKHGHRTSGHQSSSHQQVIPQQQPRIELKKGVTYNTNSATLSSGAFLAEENTIRNVANVTPSTPTAAVTAGTSTTKGCPSPVAPSPGTPYAGGSSDASSSSSTSGGSSSFTSASSSSATSTTATIACQPATKCVKPSFQAESSWHTKEIQASTDTVEIYIHSCRSLPIADRMRRSSDAYCVVQVGSYQEVTTPVQNLERALRTQVVKSSLNPEFEEKLCFCIDRKLACKVRGTAPKREYFRPKNKKKRNASPIYDQTSGALTLLTAAKNGERNDTKNGDGCKNSSKNPNWGRFFGIYCKISIWDHDLLSPHEYLGEVLFHVPSGAVLDQQTFSLTTGATDCVLPLWKGVNGNRRFWLPTDYLRRKYVLKKSKKCCDKTQSTEKCCEKKTRWKKFLDFFSAKSNKGLDNFNVESKKKKNRNSDSLSETKESLKDANKKTSTFSADLLQDQSSHQKLLGEERRKSAKMESSENLPSNEPKKKLSTSFIELPRRSGKKSNAESNPQSSINLKGSISQPTSPAKDHCCSNEILQDTPTKEDIYGRSVADVNLSLLMEGCVSFRKSQSSHGNHHSEVRGNRDENTKPLALITASEIFAGEEDLPLTRSLTEPSPHRNSKCIDLNTIETISDGVNSGGSCGEIARGFCEGIREESGETEGVIRESPSSGTMSTRDFSATSIPEGKAVIAPTGVKTVAADARTDAEIDDGTSPNRSDASTDPGSFSVSFTESSDESAVETEKIERDKKEGGETEQSDQNKDDSIRRDTERAIQTPTLVENKKSLPTKVDTVSKSDVVSKTATYSKDGFPSSIPVNTMSTKSISNSKLPTPVDVVPNSDINPKPPSPVYTSSTPTETARPEMGPPEPPKIPCIIVSTRYRKCNKKLYCKHATRFLSAVLEE